MIMITYETIKQEIDQLPQEFLPAFHEVIVAFMKLPQYEDIYSGIAEEIAETEKAIQDGTAVIYDTPDDLFKSWREEGLSTAEDERQQLINQFKQRKIKHTGKIHPVEITADGSMKIDTEKSPELYDWAVNG
jgi:hypothetical protein